MKGAGGVLAAAAAALIWAGTAWADTTRVVVSVGPTSFSAKSSSPSQAGKKTVLPASTLSDGTPVVNRFRPGRKKGKFPPKPLDPPVVQSAAVAGSNPGLSKSFTGLSIVDQVTANGGNQLFVEPPDQGLCVGNGRVLEVVNTVMRVYHSSGAPATGVVDLNTFFGYPAQYNLGTGEFGPRIADPVCLYDGDTQRWFVVALTFDVSPSGAYLGPNRLDLAVSTSPDPAGTWMRYRIPQQNDGSEGTPDHECDTGPSAAGATNPNACVGDFPRIGADRYGIYISTNEYSFFGDDYNGAQVYAISKAALAAAPLSVVVVHAENGEVDGSPGFTVWPAISVSGEHATAKNGTEYFVSTIAGEGHESGNETQSARRVGIWALVNTRSLTTDSPALLWTSRLVVSQAYVLPPRADQKPGSFPLGQAINDGFFGASPFGPETLSTPEASDTRSQQVWYVNGRLYTALNTAVMVSGELKVGIAWLVIQPKINGAGKVEGKVRQQGYLALANNNLLYPAVAVARNGRGVMAFTVMGEDYYPSAGYVRLGANGPLENEVHIAAAGAGPHDGFTGYKLFAGDPPRTRWGDYGAAVADGNDVWFASEWIPQQCTLAQWKADPTCGGTRGFFANWATGISKLTP